MQIFCGWANKVILKNVAKKLVLISPVVHRLSYLSYFEGFLGAASGICSKQHSESFFFKPFLRIQMVELCSRTVMAAGRKNSRFLQSERSDFHNVDNLPKAVYDLPKNRNDNHLIFVKKIILLQCYSHQDIKMF